MDKPKDVKPSAKRIRAWKILQEQGFYAKIGRPQSAEHMRSIAAAGGRASKRGPDKKPRKKRTIPQE